MNSKTRVLSLDGGGVRGVFAAAFLAHVEKYVPCRLVDHVELLTGTSTGSIIALGLAADLSAQEILEAYREAGPRVFPRPAGLLRRLLHPPHDQAALKAWLEKTFGGRRLKAARKPVAIPTFDAETGQAKVLKSSHHADLHTGGDKRMVEVALASSAAPTYLPAVQVEGHGAFLDGGLWANNPSMVGIIEAHRYLGAPLDSIRVLSVGTGRRKVWLAYRQVQHAGIAFWAKRMVDFVFDAQSVAASEEARLLLPKGAYHRVDVELPRNIGLDDCRELESLMHLGATEGERHLKAVERLLELRRR
jgi:patatin-like phospholipase/acyl hydrolase